MKNQFQGWKATLLFVLLFVLSFILSGCSGRAEVYTAGVREQEPQEMPAVRTEMTTGLPETDGSKEYVDSVGEEPEPAKGESEVPGEGLGSAGGEPEASGYVYVCGAVARPGVYPLHEGLRVFEALELAGGFSQDADREWLNQAELLQDGERLYVYTQEETRAITEGMQADGQPDGTVLWAENAGAAGAIGDDSEAGSAGSAGQKVNLNTADCEQLKTLPGIGDAKADAIIRYREEHGSFESIEEIQNISGIKSAVFSKIKDLITV